ncbi:lysine-specific demethylase 4E-like [Daphnia magna]|uniref:lysine-specific demethylase 4E-like n=1 Tax=Daphnia magna TaxID=35525 RepID=UPI001E1BAA33|nr:lysine-specific demethylase 4E-like [Daphnia magna]
MHNPDNKMPGINTCQLLLGHAMSYTGWHVENVNLPSINYHHSGKPKYWVVVAEKYGVLLKEFFRKNIPSFYEECRSANDPPIPFHCFKQCKGDYIITFPEAFHFVVNFGLNVAQATNFAFPEWLPFAKAREGCSCVYSESFIAVSSRFNL